MDDVPETVLAYNDEDPARFRGCAGAAWLRSNLRVELSDFGAKVAHLLDCLVGGIYHLSVSALKRANWKDERLIEITWCGGMSTYDSRRLTRLVFLCHDLGVRGEIEPCNPHYLRLRFFFRRNRTGGLCERHPTLAQALVEYDAARFGGSHA